MKKDDVMDLIMGSLPEDYTYVENKDLYVYNSDINLRIVLEDESSERPLIEPWTEKFLDKRATTQLVYIYYGCTPLHKMVCVWVDGYRYLIPMPRSRDDLTIGSLEYKIGTILSYHSPYNDFDQALARAGINHW